MTEKGIIAITTAVTTVITVGLNTVKDYIVPGPEPEAQAANGRLEAAYNALKKSFDAQAERLDQLAGAQATAHGWLEGLRWHIERMEERFSERLARLHPRRAARTEGRRPGEGAEESAPPELPPRPAPKLRAPPLPDFNDVQQMAR